jgi:hypothetical protein
MQDLIKAIQDLHSCRAAYSESVEIKEEFEGRTVWEGTVHVFNIEDHPDTDTCYAWSSLIEGSDKLKYYAVLHVPPVDSPEMAVRASIVVDHKNEDNQ